MPNLAVQSMTLAEIESELNAEVQQFNNLKNHLEKSQWHIIELLWHGKGYFSSNTEFKNWAAIQTGYKVKTVEAYTLVYDRFRNHELVRSNQNSDNPIPINKLAPLAAQNVSHRTVDEFVKKLISKQPPTVAYIRRHVKISKTHDVSKYFNPPFETRSQQKGKFVAGPEYLLDVDQSNQSAETVKILANYWKNKFHPDKGGDPKIFDRIVKAEKALLKKRGI